jgi:predicted membrane channel-forming protein YqfA (hemolysin III family)
MEGAYTLSTGGKIVYMILVLMLAGFALFILFIPSYGFPFLKLFSLLVMGICVMVTLNLFKLKIEISEYSITYSRLFSTRELPRVEIKGVRIEAKRLILESLSNPSANITINNYSSFEQAEQLIVWLRETFPDLNEKDYKQELTEILQDDRLGLSQEERNATLQRAKYASTVYNVMGGAMFFTLFAHKNSELKAIILLIYPFIGCMVILSSKGLIKLVARASSAYRSVFIGLVIPCMVLMFTSLSEFNLLHHQPFWLPFLGISLLLGLILYLIQSKKEKLKTRLLSAVCIALVYGAGSTLQLNCTFDHSAGEEYSATVMGRKISKGKNDTYYLVLSPWGPEKTETEVAVSRIRYEYSLEKSVLKIRLKKGLLDIPWFYIE